MLKANSIFRNLSFNLSGSIWEVATDLCIIAIIARYLGPERFGSYAFIMALATAFRALSGVGLPVIITREVALDREKADSMLTGGLLVELAMSVVTMGIIAAFINLVTDDRQIVTATYYAAGGVILELIATLLIAFPRAFERMEYAAYRIFVTQTCYLACLASLIAFGHQSDKGFALIFVSFLISHALGCAYALYIVVTRFAKPRLVWDWECCRFLFMASLPLLLRRFSRRITFRADTMLLWWLAGKVEVGLFHAAYKIVQGAMFIGGNVIQAAFPALTRLYRTGQDSMDRLYSRVYRSLAICGAGVALVVYSFPAKIVRVILGKDFTSSAVVLKIFSIIILFMFLIKLAERMLVIGSRQNVAAILGFVCLLLNVSLDLLLIPRWGIVGASVATLAAEAVLFVSGAYYTYRYISKAPLVLATIAILGSYCLACSTVTLASVAMGQVLGFLFGLAVYVLIVLATRAIRPHELAELIGVMRLRAERWATSASEAE